MAEITALLSSEILTEILSMLDLRSFLNACVTCKDWLGWINEDFFWKSFYRAQFNVQTLHRPDLYKSWQDQFKKHYSYNSWRRVEQLKMSDEVWNAKFSPNGRFLAYTGKSGDYTIWQINFNPQRQTIELNFVTTREMAEAGGIGRLSWSPDSKKLLVTYKNETFGVVDLANLKYTHLGDCDIDTHANFLSDKSFIYTKFGMDLPEEEDDMEYLHTTSIHLNTLNNAGDYVSQSSVKITSADGLLSGAISEAKKYVAYEHGTDRFQLYLYPIAKIEAADAQAKVELKEKDLLVINEFGELFGYCFTNDDKRIFVVAKDMREDVGNNEVELHLWDIETKKVIRTWNIGQTDLQFVLLPSMTTDDQIVLVGDYNGNVYIIHKESDKIIHKFEAHKYLVNYVTMHPTLDLLVTASDSSEVGLWVPRSSKLNIVINRPFA